MPITRAELKNAQSLLTKKGRRRQGEFLAEGVRLLEEALRFSFPPVAVYFAPSVLSERGNELVARFRAAKVVCEEVSARQIEQLADTQTPQGIIGRFKIPNASLPQLYRKHYRTILVCENLGDPGNLGTLLRSALAFGFRLTVLVGSTAEPFSPKVVRSSEGAVFGLTIAEADYEELATLITGEKISMFAATARGAANLAERLSTGTGSACALAVGSEPLGLSQQLLELASARIRIDHSPDVESLNAAVAGSILMKGIYDLLQ